MNQPPGLKAREPLSFLDPVVLYGVFGLLLFAPLAFGTTDTWAIFLLEATSASLFVLWLCRQFVSAECVIRWNPLFAPMLAFLLLIIGQLALKTSAYSYATISAAELYCAYAFLCFLVVQYLRSISEVIILTWIFSGYGLIVAVFSLIQGLSSNGKIYWLRLPHSSGWIYGPYVNHNHYAGLMEMLFPIPLVFSMTVYASGGRRMLAIFAATVMAATIFLSGSRGGMAAFGLELTVFCAILLSQRKTPIHFRRRASLAVFSVALLVLLVWIGGEALRGRLTGSMNDLSQEIRLQIDRDLVKAVPQRPLLGWGLGTFGDIYPQFRSFSTTKSIDEAHNDYLQFLIEMGFLGLIIATWFLGLVFFHAWKKLRHWVTDIDGAVGLAAILGIMGILLHSFVDFNLQVPANAAIFYVLCTITAMKPVCGYTNRKVETPLRP